MTRWIATVVAAAACLAAAAAPAWATPVATSDADYARLGRVFPDPLAGCAALAVIPCSPNAQGNQPATQFIQYSELIDGLAYLSSKPQWRRYLEVWPLDGKIGPGAGTDERAAFPGNDLGRFEFEPRPEYRSAGLPTTDLGRKVSDLIVARITDERVPDRGKKRYTVTLSIHGIERAGAEGGTRAIEDLVTAYTTGLASRPILPAGVERQVPTFGDVLRRAIVYVGYPNPDGWRRGSIDEGGVFFQRYNGNGVDLNRDWPDVGFAFRPYSTDSEPETRAFDGFYGDMRRSFRFHGSADLHGQLEADALSYTLLTHGRHDFGKNLRAQETAKAIHRASEKALAWSPLIQPNDAPQGGGLPCVPPLVGGATCAQIYGQTWGTVYDTINYTTTGTLGDWFDSPIGLNTDGIDNEMSFSHLDKNILFEPQTEQLHVDGNKSLIYAQLTEMLNPARGSFQAPGRKAYFANPRLRRRGQAARSRGLANVVPQPDIIGRLGYPDLADGGRIVLPIDVQRSAPAAGRPGIYNGGMRVDVTSANLQGISSGLAALTIQCRFCDQHPGVKDDGEWVTVTEDFNQANTYLQAGLTATVNDPQAFAAGKKVEWRAVVGLALGAGGTRPPAGTLTPLARMDVHFTKGPAAATAETGSPQARAPRLRAYDVANSDFFRDLNRFIRKRGERFRRLDPRRVAARREPLGRYASIALADNPLPVKLLPAREARWYARLRSYVKRGGNLVLTDAALRALPRLTSIPASAVASRKVYVGQVTFATDADGDTLADPLARDVKQPGARFNTGMRRQTYEPVPLGYSIQDPVMGADESHSPQWDVDAAEFRKAGGRVVGTSVSEEPSGDPVYDRVTLGEIKLGRGTIRIVGSLLPQPTEAFDHDFGIEPYSVTYTGYTLVRNLLTPGA